MSTPTSVNTESALHPTLPYLPSSSYTTSLTFCFLPSISTLPHPSPTLLLFLHSHSFYSCYSIKCHIVSTYLPSIFTTLYKVERRNRLRLLHPWLEARVAQGNIEPALHNAIGKIYITLNREPLQFLQNNQFYEPAVIGAFCEKLDPHLAFEAYKSARGTYVCVCATHTPSLLFYSVLFS